MTYEEFAAQHGVTIESHWLASRVDIPADQFSKLACHYQVTLTCNGRTIFNGPYSVGIGVIENWAKKNLGKIPPGYRPYGHFNLREALTNPLPYGKRYRDDSPYYEGLREMAAKHYRPGVGEILECIASDAAGADESFADWAANYGYSDDSIKAKAIWESCNAIRRTLRDGLGPEKYAQLIECEE